MKETELNKVLNYMKQYVEDKYEHDSEPMLNYKDLTLILNEIERLKEENNDLRKLYQRTYKHLFEIGNDELARYFQAQVDECPTFYVEPIIDYYKETKRLNNIINESAEEILKELEENNHLSYGVALAIRQKLLDYKELKGSDKE